MRMVFISVRTMSELNLPESFSAIPKLSEFRHTPLNKLKRRLNRALITSVSGLFLKPQQSKDGRQSDLNMSGGHQKTWAFLFMQSEA
jgi:hypothetical protein